MKKYIQKGLYSRSNNISLFKPPIQNTKPFLNVSVFNIYKRIVADDNLKKITQDYQKGIIKKQVAFPFVTFSGVFSERNNKGLKIKNNYIVLDIDDVNNPSTLKEILSKDIHILLAFISPSKNGLKVVVKYDIPNIEHKKVFDKIVSYFEEKYGIEIDKSGSDIARACFLCYDDEAYYNEIAQVFTESSFITYTDEDNTIKQIEYCIEQIEERELDVTESYNQWRNIGFALANLEEEGREYFHKVSQFHSEYSYEETDKKFDAILRTTEHKISVATFFHYCKEYGIELNSFSKIESEKTECQINDKNFTLTGV